MIVELAFDDFVAGLGDQVSDLLGEFAELSIGQCSRLLQDTQSMDHGTAPHEGVTTDVEVVQGTLGLGAPVAVGGDLDGAH